MQVLNWLCKKGEDVLAKHAQHIATTLTAARLNEREFEKFYFTSMVSTIFFLYTIYSLTFFLSLPFKARGG